MDYHRRKGIGKGRSISSYQS